MTKKKHAQQFIEWNPDNVLINDLEPYKVVLKRIKELMELDEIPDIFLAPANTCGLYSYMQDDPLDGFVQIDASKFWEMRDMYEFSWMKNVFWQIMIHELQHYKQYVTKTMSKKPLNQCGLFRYTWKGYDYIVDNTLHVSQTTYMSSPWELDANREAERIGEILIKENMIPIDKEYVATQNLWGCLDNPKFIYRVKHYWKRLWAW